MHKIIKPSEYVSFRWQRHNAKSEKEKKIQIAKNTTVMNSVLGVSHAIAQFQLSH